MVDRGGGDDTKGVSCYFWRGTFLLLEQSQEIAQALLADRDWRARACCQESFMGNIVWVRFGFDWSRSVDVIVA